MKMMTASQFMQEHDTDFDINGIADWSLMKSYVRPRLLGKEMEEYLADKIHSKFLDMYVMYYVQVSNGGEVISAPVSKALFGAWGITEYELDYTAVKNQTDILMPLADFVKDLTGENPGDDYCFNVLTNPGMYFGAALILDTDRMNRLAELFNDDVGVIPSSVHETIVFPGRHARQELADMIHMVNESHVAPCDRLSDNMYVFKRETGDFERF